jgi:hypothetical protein
MKWLTPWVAVSDDATRDFAVLFTQYEVFRRGENDFSPS